MNQNKIILLFTGVIIILSNSCAEKKINPYPKNISAKLMEYILEIKNKNSLVKPLKGTGFLEIYSEKGLNTYNLAFASDGQKKFRIEILAPTGLPVLKIAFDGKKIYFSENNSKVKSYKKPEKILKKFLGFKIKPEILAFLLTGKTPLIEYDSGFVDIKNNLRELVLFNSLKKVSEKIIYSQPQNFKQIIFYKDNKKKYFINIKKNRAFVISSIKNNARITFFKSFSMEIKNINNNKLFILTR